MNRHRVALLVALALGLCETPARAQRGPFADPLVRENVTVKLGPHTYAIPDGNAVLVPNVGIVVGTRATLVIDPGLGRRNGEAVLREVAKVSTHSELYVASTHFHVEHTLGYVAFPASAKYVNSTIQEAEFAEGGMPQVQTFSAFSPGTAELLKGATRRVADITFDREHVLDLGGVRVRMLVVGPTHTKGDTVFFVEGDGVLFAGDVVMNNSFVAAGPASSTRAWLTAFDRLGAMRPTTIVPAHGEIGPAAMLPTLQAVVAAIQARARELKGQGRTLEEVGPAVQKEMQAKFPTWARANGVAALARSAFAEAP